ncbi:MAG: hypothetical protein RR939_02985 [Acinetobacter sp.]
MIATTTMNKVEAKAILLAFKFPIPFVMAGKSNHKPYNPKASKSGASIQKSVPNFQKTHIKLPNKIAE